MVRFTIAALAFAASASASKRGESSQFQTVGAKTTRGLKGMDMPASMKGDMDMGKKETCNAPIRFNLNEAAQQVLSHVNQGDAVIAGLAQYASGKLTIGSTTALIPEAADASATGAPVEDGMSGDIDFPHGNLKPLVTVGEYNACEENLGTLAVGVPDGLGAYLLDDNTVRTVVQSESYGPLEGKESYPLYVNDRNASFTGSHVQYADLDREGLAKFMDSDKPASSFVTGFGEVVKYVVNLKGERVGPRNRDEEPTTYGAHYGNTDIDGNYVVLDVPSEADWLMQSLCSAHLEEMHQWGPGIGFEDNIFLTNEEWIEYQEDVEFVGISSHAIDLANSIMYAIGAIGNSGFEKIVEMNSQHPDYIILAVSGYNGDFISEKVLSNRKEKFGSRPDGSDYVWPENIVPSRIYIGVKGKMEDGSDAPSDDFLARNGLRYGQLYGYAVDMSNDGPTKGAWRDEFHSDPKKAHNGAYVPGKWIAIDWMWDGEVKNFEHDGSWHFQAKPPGTKADSYYYWNALGNDEPGCKTEHVSPDPRDGMTGFVQGSTCGYFGHYYVHDIAKVLLNSDDGLPSMIDGSYYVYQGERDVTKQIELGGKGQYADGLDATRNYSDDKTERVTFEDVDGIEVINSADGHIRLIIQEDSGNNYGERIFISSPLEHDDDGKELTYYFIAMSGGDSNTRMLAGVGIPAGVNSEANGHEFSGIFDMSGLLRKWDNEFVLKADDDGHAKRAQDAMVDINDKYILLGLQAHNFHSGLIGAFKADRGGQWLVYQPHV